MFPGLLPNPIQYFDNNGGSLFEGGWGGRMPGWASSRCAWSWASLSVKKVQQAACYFCERGALMRVPPQAPLGQVRVLGGGSLGEMGEECVG